MSSSVQRFVCSDGQGPAPVPDAQGTLVQRLGLGVFALLFVEVRQVVKWIGYLGVIEQFAEQVEHLLVEPDLRGRTLTLKVKWSDFQLITRSVSRSEGFQDARTMMPVLRLLLAQLDGEKRPVRLLGVSVSNLLTQDEVQRSEQITALTLWNIE